MIQNNEALTDFISQGGTPHYLYFWGHQKPKSGVSKSCFSQWYDASFEESGIRFHTAEHYMMYQKAKLFGDLAVAEKIIQSALPSEVKQLGREVSGFDEAIWNQQRFNIVVQANRLKFGQNSDLLAFLLSTGESILVEASPVDPVWGIGLAANDERAADPAQWRGENLLGYALMLVRKEFTLNS
ncbi:NADAR family protein [Photobacterium galatheae]|uniref:NADAR family protein n=1 Tax=Photobacterium galatheae TaxID=1654360 RepID=UPI00202CE573|nr:NADAR family protein [Photobacterium galatheae]MCM0147177.1 NADAR family protein [Photobacterium galatheae]